MLKCVNVTRNANYRPAFIPVLTVAVCNLDTATNADTLSCQKLSVGDSAAPVAVVCSVYDTNALPDHNWFHGYKMLWNAIIFPIRFNSSRSRCNTKRFFYQWQRRSQDSSVSVVTSP